MNRTFVTAAALAAGTAFLASPAVAAPTPAPAKALSLATCAGTNKVTYTPGLTNTPHPTTLDGTTSLDCVSLTPGVPLALHGTITGHGAGVELSCAVLEAASSGTSTVKWTSNGQPYGSSTYAWNSSVSPGADGTTVTTLTGKIGSGVFKNATIVIATVRLNTDLAACQTEQGLTSRSGLLTATIVG
jgi:hypothetical protein